MKRILCVMLCMLLGCAPALAEDVPYEYEMELLDGGTVKLSDYEGYVTIISMWATWCPGCVAELPVLQQLHETYPDTVRVLAVNQGEDAETIRDFLSGQGYTFPVAMDPYGLMLNYIFPSDYIPYLVILDEESRIIYEKVGGGGDLFEELSGILEIHQMFKTAEVTLPAESEDGQTALAVGIMEAQTDTGFLLTLEDGSQISCLWAGQMPETGTLLEAVGVMAGGELQIQGLKMASAQE